MCVCVLGSQLLVSTHQRRSVLVLWVLNGGKVAPVHSSEDPPQVWTHSVLSSPHTPVPFLSRWQLFKLFPEVVAC